MSNINNLTKGITSGIFNKCIGLLLPFLSRTVLIYTLGLQYVGLNSLFSSILQVLNFSELGLGSAIVYLLYKPLADNDTNQINSILNFCKKCYRYIGLFITVVGLILMPFINVLINGSIPDGINIYILYIINLINSVAGYYLYAYKQTLLIATQRVDVYNLCGVIADVVLNILQVIVLILWKNFYIFSVVRIVSTVMNSLLCDYYSRKLYPQFFPKGDISVIQKSELKLKVGGMIFQKISNVILISADTIVISSFLNLEILGKYNSYYYIISALVLFLGAIDQAVIPVAGNYIVKESKQNSRNFFFIMDSLISFAVVWFSACYFVLCQDFMRIWIGNDKLFGDGIVVLFALYFFFYRIKDMLNIYIDADGLWWKVKFIAFGSALFNLATNIILVNFLGVYGVLISTIISFVFIDIPLNSIALSRFYFEDKKFIREYISTKIVNIIQLLVVAGISIFIGGFFSVTNVISFGIKMLAIGIVTCVITLLTFILNKDFRKGIDFIKEKRKNVK